MQLAFKWSAGSKIPEGMEKLGNKRHKQTERQKYERKRETMMSIS
jgi:hypothetical protein